MVKIYKSTENLIIDKDILSKYPFELSDFQKYSIYATINGHNSLITAGTGSGKTLPAEFAIEYFVKKGKKVIYTSPIKALSNQKYYEFTKKFPDISFGLITGDIKCGQNASCLIMTCEILRNHFFKLDRVCEIAVSEVSKIAVSEVSKIAVSEVSKIAVSEVGKIAVSEVSKIAVSENEASKYKSTQFDIDINDIGCVIFDEVHYINDDERGTVWEESIVYLAKLNIQMILLSATINEAENFAKWIESISQREIYLSGTSKRIVPLKHYMFVNFSKVNEIIKNSISFKEVDRVPLEFNLTNYKKIKSLLENKNLSSTKSNQETKPFIINEVTNYLHSNNMLPAIFFSLSRKNVEQYPHFIQSNLLLFDQFNEVEDTCKKIMMKLPNYREYINTSEYTNLIKFLEKGVAYHHSGMLSIYREIVELLFSKGLIKLLFATETFSVGINMPTKTVIFDSFKKFDGNSTRFLRSHEYAQMAGRAGRRGIDTIGHVFHLNNLFDLPEFVVYNSIINGNPQKIESKFKLDLNFIIRFLKNDLNETQIEQNSTKSNENSTKSNEIQIKQISSFVLKTFEAKDTQVDEYFGSIKVKNKKNSFFESQIKNLIDILKKYKFVENQQNRTFELTKYGIYASAVQEAPLAFSLWIDELVKFEPAEIAAILSMFTPKINEESKSLNETNLTNEVKSLIKSVNESMYTIESDLNRLRIVQTHIELSYDLCDFILEWSVATDEQKCKEILSNYSNTGSIAKAMLKICNLVNEMKSVVSVDLEYKLSKIDSLLLKYIITNQSLYI